MACINEQFQAVHPEESTLNPSLKYLVIGFKWQSRQYRGVLLDPRLPAGVMDDHAGWLAAHRCVSTRGVLALPGPAELAPP